MSYMYESVSCCVYMHKIIQLQHIGNNTIDLCQNCLAESLPFQTLDDLEFEFTVLKGINMRKDEMDRLRHLKLNPFDTSNSITLCYRKTMQISINRQK